MAKITFIKGSQIKKIRETSVAQIAAVEADGWKKETAEAPKVRKGNDHG